MAFIPTQLEPSTENPKSEMRIAWNDGAVFYVPYTEIRYHCPCAGCVDEHTGKRTLQRSAVSPDVRPLGLQLVGKYAVQINWSDRHETGMYHFDLLRKICEKAGRKL